MPHRGNVHQLAAGSKKVSKKPSGNASQLAGNDAQPRETSTTGADEVMDRIRALGYVPKETKTISKHPIVTHLACNIRRMKKRGSFSRAQLEEIDALSAQGDEQTRIDKAARIVEKIRNLGYIPPLDNRYPELNKVRRVYDLAVKNRIINAEQEQELQELTRFHMQTIAENMAPPLEACAPPDPLRPFADEA